MTVKRTYYDRATSWALDSQAETARSRRIAWTLAGIAIGVALFEAVALAMLAPLKSVQTVTLLVDKQTGFVQAVNPLQPQRVLADEALTNAFLAQYVVAREGFDRATVASDYRKVALWSAGRARSTYVAMMPTINPTSPFKRLPAGTLLQAAVKSVSRLSLGLALVRFDTVEINRSGQRSAPQPWVAVIRFGYVNATMRVEDRLINPLGFQVTGYRRDQEAPPPFAVVAPSAVAATIVPPAPLAPVTATTMPETTRHVQRSVPVVPAARRVPTARAIGSTGSYSVPREVPLNQLPLGSPLSPSGLPSGSGS